jgi:aldose 1-epimerase
MTGTAQPLSLQRGRQRLQLLPELGGSIGAWDLQQGDTWLPLLRPWNGLAADAYTYACFPLVPWSNRISGGGFTHDGVVHPVALNRAGENYPIHGDGWLQPWSIARSDPDGITLELSSNRYAQDPYHYRASQRFEMNDDGLTIILQVTHLGEHPLPYGLGLHPYFPRDAETRLQMHCTGLWLSGADPMPVSHSAILPETFDYRQPAPLDGPMIDHCFTGWDGQATIRYPNHGLTLELTMPQCDGYALMYRPPGLDFFCLEPITHPIDAFHLAGQPGLRILGTGESMDLTLQMRVRSD